MKGKLTITVTDNETGRELAVLNADSVNYNFTPESVRILAYYPQDALELDDDVTEKITDCRFGHSFVTSTGFTTEVTHCEQCGLELKTDEV